MMTRTLLTDIEDMPIMSIPFATRRFNDTTEKGYGVSDISVSANIHQ